MTVRVRTLIALALPALLGAIALLLFAPAGEAQVADEQAPFAEVTVPARIEAEHFDIGAPGIAYADTDGAFGNFRSDDVDDASAVDVWTIENTGSSGALIGRTRDGEYVEYTVEVAEADTFEIRLAVASGADSPGVINVDVDDAEVGTVDGGTNRWFDWRVRSAGTIELDPGTHIVRLTWDDGANVNFDWFEIRSTTPSAVSCPTGTIEAEDATRNGRFELVENDDANGGFHVEVPRGSGGWWNGASDNWVDFCVGVETAGTYQIETGLRSPTAGDNSFYVTVDRSPVVDFVADVTGADFGIDVVNDRPAIDPLRTGDAERPTIDEVAWPLDAGDHHVRFYLRRDGAQLDWIRLVSADGDDAGEEDPIVGQPADPRATATPAATPLPPVIADPPFPPTPTPQRPDIIEPPFPTTPTVTPTPQRPDIIEPPFPPTPTPDIIEPPFPPPPFPPTPIPGGDCRSVEDDGSIDQANTVFVGGPQCLGRIGDGPYGETSGDFDVWAIDTQGLEGAIRVGAASFQSDRPVTAFVVDAEGNSAAQGEFGGYPTVGGPYYVIVGSEGTFLNDPFNSASGDGAVESGTYELFVDLIEATCVSQEDDGSSLSANRVPFFETCLGRIGDGPHAETTGDVDVWNIGSGLGGSPIYMEIFAEGESLLSMALFREDGELVVSLNNIDDVGILDTEVPDDAGYYLVVAADGNELEDIEDSSSGNSELGTADYELFVALLPIGEPPPPPPPICESVEDDGMIESANFLEPFFPCGGVIGDGPYAGTSGDFDIWILEGLTPNDGAVFDLRGVEAEVSGRLYDEEGSLVGPIVNGETIPFDQDVYFAVVGPEGESLADLNDSASGSGAAPVATFYEFSIRVIPPPPEPLPRPNDGCDSEEDDSNIELANVVDVGPMESVTCFGVLGDGPDANLGDHDFFVVTDVAAGESLAFDIDASIFGSRLDSFIVVYDSNFEVLTGNDDSFESLDSFTEFIAPADGDYYIGVGACCSFLFDPTDSSSGGPPTSTGEYLLTIERGTALQEPVPPGGPTPTPAPEIPQLGPFPEVTPTPLPTPRVALVFPTPTATPLPRPG